MSDHESQADQAAREEREREETARAELAALEAQWEQDAIEPTRTRKAQKKQPPLKGGTE